jgi:hypothetical protein
MLIDRCRGGRTDLIRFLASPLVCQFAKFVAMGGKHVLRWKTLLPISLRFPKAKFASLPRVTGGGRM